MSAQTSFPDLLQLAFDPPDEELRYGDNPLQFAEGWRHSAAAPTLVMIHGGCWLADYDLSHVRPLCTAIRGLGINVWSLEYRRIGNPGGCWPGTFEDVIAGLRRVHQETAAVGQQQRFWLAGHSAGGHLALWASTRFQNGVVQDDGLVIEKTLGLAAILDLAGYSAGESGCEKATLSLLEGTPADRPKRYLEAAPVRTDANRGITLLTGSEDTIVGPEHARWFTAASKADVINIEGAGHFDLVNPIAPAFDALRSVLVSV
jgi:acetyl esterase/lipase